MVEQYSASVAAGIGARALEPDAVMALVDASPDGVMVVDGAGIVRFANLAATAIFTRGQELVGSEFGIPLVSMDKVDIDVPRGQEPPGVYELRVAAAAWQGTPANLVTVRDVTERARHEATVQQLNRELQLRADAAMVLEHVGDGVVLLDAAGIVRRWNPAAERILDLPAERALGHSMVDVVPGWDRVRDGVPLHDADAGEQPTGSSVLLDVDGHERWLSITGTRFDGGTVYAFHDLTEEVRVATLKRDFIDTASHELRTPLTSIYGAAHTLRRTELDLPEDVRADLVEVIWTQAQRLHRITENILATRKLDHDTLSIRESSFDAVALAVDVIEAVRPRAGATMELDVVDLLGADRFLVADQDKLRQVLGNLVGNAVKYSPDGGRVCLYLEHEGNLVVFAVRDHGLGMTGADADRAFDKFYRSSAHEGRSIEGTGLGLYIARELARRMGGDIEVSSEPAVGSTFTIKLPRDGRPATRSERTPPID